VKRTTPTSAAPNPTAPSPATPARSHTKGWISNNGQTNINELTLACGPDNRLAEDGWTVEIRHGVAEWIPPPELEPLRLSAKIETLRNSCRHFDDACSVGTCSSTSSATPKTQLLPEF
jgi:hypothetical protein